MVLKTMSNLDSRKRKKTICLALVIAAFMAMLFFMRDYFIKYNPKYCIMSKFITNNLQVIPRECKSFLPEHFYFASFVDLKIGSFFIQDSIYNDYYYDLFLTKKIFFDSLVNKKAYSLDNSEKVYLNNGLLYKWFSDSMFKQLLLDPDTLNTKLFVYCIENKRTPCFLSYNPGVVHAIGDSGRIRELNFIVEKIDSLDRYYNCVSR